VPPAFSARHLQIRLKPPGDDGGVTEWWPKRNLLLVEMPDRARLVLELTSAPFDPRRLDEPRPSSRVSLSGGGVVETWTVRDPELEGNPGKAQAPARWDDPCGGGWQLLYGAGVSARLESPSAFTRTMRAVVADLRDAALRPEDVARLETVFRIEPPTGAHANDLYASRAAAGLLLVDRPRRNRGPRFVLTRSPEPPGDLAPWRALSEIPTSLPPYLFVPGPRS
jgi:hypothetical protein